VFHHNLSASDVTPAYCQYRYEMDTVLVYFVVAGYRVSFLDGKRSGLEGNSN
jgi:hypothetical protein